MGRRRAGARAKPGSQWPDVGAGTGKDRVRSCQAGAASIETSHDTADRLPRHPIDDEIDIERNRAALIP
jgi:hypothetical protein